MTHSYINESDLYTSHSLIYTYERVTNSLRKISMSHQLFHKHMSKSLSHIHTSESLSHIHECVSESLSHECVTLSYTYE